MPAGRVVAFGRSLGRPYAIELARRPPDLGGLVLESGIATPSEQWKFTKEEDEIGCRVGEIEAAMAVPFDHRAFGPTIADAGERE